MTTTSTRPVTITAPEGLPFIDIEREFDAPVEAVFNAHRDPELVKQWLGPSGYEMTIERWDFVPQRRLPLRAHDRRGRVLRRSTASFHTVRENEFAIQTFEFEGYPDVVAIESDDASKTWATAARGSKIHSVYPDCRVPRRHGRERHGDRPARGLRTPRRAARRRRDTFDHETGAPSWTGPSRSSSLPVSDLDGAIAFYRDQVGFTLDHNTVMGETCGFARSPRADPGCSIVMGTLPAADAR